MNTHQMYRAATKRFRVTVTSASSVVTITEMEAKGMLYATLVYWQRTQLPDNPNPKSVLIEEIR